MNRVRQPFNVNTSRWRPPSPRWATRHSSREPARSTAAGWPARRAASSALGLEYIPSSGNFVAGPACGDAGARVYRDAAARRA